MAMAPALRELLSDEGIARLVSEAAPFARAFARVLPAATVVPALAVRGTPPQVRFAVALALSAPIAAAFPWTAGVDPPLALMLVSDALRGIPLAILLATPLWVATHIGAIADVLRGAPEATIAPPPAAEGARTPLATLTALLVASAWLSSGGVVRALHLLSASGPRGASPISPGVAPWALAARALTDGMRLSIALSAGVLVAATTLEVALADIGRAGAPLSPQPIAVVARPLVAVIALGLSIEMAIAFLVR